MLLNSCLKRFSFIFLPVVVSSANGAAVLTSDRQVERSVEIATGSPFTVAVQNPGPQWVRTLYLLTPSDAPGPPDATPIPVRVHGTRSLPHYTFPTCTL